MNNCSRRRETECINNRRPLRTTPSLRDSIALLKISWHFTSNGSTRSLNVCLTTNGAVLILNEEKLVAIELAFNCLLVSNQTLD
ncbi:unnamed protein product [Lactuca virosa]|uniref:Uncharacterized protein n=1 Tax=Lactuca virosa TaxID=75947 RepID=A0AAU9P882_9ASTR|nr:unnamed protein product [Lactuca virosa]